MKIKPKYFVIIIDETNFFHPHFIRSLVKKLIIGNAKILVGLDNAISLAKKIISKKLSVRQTENLVRMLKSSSNSTSKKKDPNIVSLEEELTDKIGMRVFVKNKRNNSGTISLEYKEADQLDRLVAIIRQNY